MYLQQGDVILEKVNDVEGVKIKHNGVLMEGEVTGHAHRIVDIAGVEFYNKDGLLYLKTNKPIDVVHEEHGTITVDPGIYKIRKVREYDHFDEEAREVRD